MDTDLKISETLEELMRSRGISLRDISRATKVPVSSLSEWKSNNRHPNSVQAAKVASFLGVTLHFLLFGVEDQNEPIQKIMKEDFFKGTFEISIKRVKIDDK